ncbi:MAG TPA: aminotransferase class V-fold PLP-dependent enzyme [Rhizomicrobium sp.]|jgi:selenocysteine lyase/cysteine desulfurase|nr:aminotransferase class V-fold PLP-dependent enzyme [Rhizomicrobium sp.]
MNGFSLSIGAPGAPLHAAAHSHHPWPDVTLVAQEQAWRDAAHLLDRKWQQIFATVIPQAQAHVARILGLPDPSSIVFGPNTHSFVVRVLSCLPQARPPRVLTSSSEFMSFARQIARLEEDGATVTRVACEPFESFEARFCESARTGEYDLIYVSQVFFDSGFALRDLQAIVNAATNPETFVVIDGYHGFMAIPTDLSAIAHRAYYLAGGYKYAMAGEGACFLHCPPGYGARPRNTGWYAGFSALEQGGGGVPFATDGSRFLGATFDVSGLYRFNAVQDWLLLGEQNVAGMLAQVRALERAVLAELDRLHAPVGSTNMLVSGENDRGRFLAFRTGEAAAISGRLAANNIIVDHRGDRLRIGFGIYHEPDDAVQLARAIALLPPSP